MKKIILSCLSILAFGTSQAAVINSADVNGFRTFQDTNTGLIWLDMNNFFEQSTASMIAAANVAGFAFATRGDVDTLLNSLPLNAGEWPGYASIMGSAPNRGLIWGSYDDGGDAATVGWGWAYDNETIWTRQDGADGINSIPNSGTLDADMNIWAFRVGAVVPEPSLLALFGLGLAGVAFVRRRT